VDAAQIARELISVSVSGTEVCPRCRGIRYEESPYCKNCRDVLDQLSQPTPNMLPISLYAKPSTLREWLKRYKDSEEGPADPVAAPIVGLIMSEFLLRHWSTLTRHWGDIDVLCVVPSTSEYGRDSRHPLELAVTGDGRITANFASLLRRGDTMISHNRASDAAYEATGDAAGRRVLLLDDVYTTGAHAQSAASALAMAGADVRGLVVLGRRINPSYHQKAAAMLERQSAAPFDFDLCPFWVG
jgi:predicted amidophosphoribosyltransferase